MAFPKLNQWSDKVYQAGTTGGFNILRDLERELQQAIPDLKAYNIGLFVEDDLKNVMPIGWVYMDYGHLDYETVESFNNAIGLRYGIVIDSSGHLKVGDNYIMIMPKDYREKVKAERKRAYDLQNQEAMDASTYVPQSDPRYEEMQEGAREAAQKGTSSKTVRVGGEPDGAVADEAPPKKKGWGKK